MRVEIYVAPAPDTLAWVADFAFVPRAGEYLSLERPGGFQFFNVLEVWHRGVEGGAFTPCVLIELDD